MENSLIFVSWVKKKTDHGSIRNIVVVCLTKSKLIRCEMNSGKLVHVQSNKQKH